MRVSILYNFHISLLKISFDAKIDGKHLAMHLLRRKVLWGVGGDRRGEEKHKKKTKMKNKKK